MDVLGYESFYRVSDGGDVFSKIRNRKVKPYLTKKGYLHIDLRGKTVTVHRLVLSHFGSVKDMETLQVNHLNSDKTDNRRVNLEWCTNQENSDHSWANGRQAARGSSCNSKLKESHVLAIKALLREGLFTQKEIGERYGVAKSTIGKIATGKNWSWLK